MKTIINRRLIFGLLSIFLLLGTTVIIGAAYGSTTSYGSTDFVISDKSNNVVHFLTSSGSGDGSIAVGTSPWGVAVNQAGTRAYVSNNGSGTVSVINLGTKTVATTVTVGTKPSGLAVTPDGTKVFVANYGSNSVSVIQTSDNTVASTINGFNYPIGVVASPDGSYVYVTNQGNGTVYKIAVSNNAITKFTNYRDSAALLKGIAISPDGSTIYVAAPQYDAVFSTTTSDGSNSTCYGVSKDANWIAVNPANTKLYVTNNTNGQTAYFNVGTSARQGTVGESGSGSEGVQVDPTGTYCYVVNYNVHHFHRIALSDNSYSSINTTMTGQSWSDGNAFFRPINPPLLTADPTASSTNVNYGTSITAYDHSTNDAGRPSSTIDWDWGDGTAHGSGSSPSHSYNAGSYTITENVSNNAGYVTDTIGVTVNKATPSITWSNPNAITYGSNMNSLSTSPSSGGVAGSYSYSPALSTVPSYPGTTVTATFTPTDTSNYNSGSQGSCSVTVNKANPSLSYSPSPTTITYGTGLVSGQLNAASGGVSGTFAYTVAGSGVSAGTVLGAGSKTILATFTSSDSNYNSGGTTSAVITVNKATPTLSWSNPTAITQGTALSGTQLNAGNSLSVAGSYTYTPISGTVLRSGAGQTLSCTFTPTDSTDYNGCSGSASITVNPSTPSAGLSGTPTSGTLPLTVQFSDTSTYTGNNLLTDAGSENAVPPGCGGSQVDTPARSTSYAHTGSASLSVHGTGASGDYATIGAANIPLSASTQYYWEAWVYCPQATYVTPGYMQDDTPAGWQVISGSNGLINGVGGLQALAAGAWTKISGYGTTPSNCYATGHFIFNPAQSSNGNDDTGKTLYYDDIRICTASWSWNFGDGITSTANRPSHVYYQPGTYNVSLQTTATGNANTATQTSYITSSQPTPTAGIGANVSTGQIPLSVQFSDTSTVNNLIDNGDIESSLPRGDVPSNANEAQSTTYHHGGSNSLRLISTSAAADCFDCINQACLTIQPSTQYYWEVWAYSPVSTHIDTSSMFIQENGHNWASTGSVGYINGVTGYQALAAGTWTKIYGIGSSGSDFDSGIGAYNNRLILRPGKTDSTHFDTSNYIYYDDIKAYPVTYAWNFGDGTANSTSQNPIHTYASSGTYTVTLTTTTGTASGSTTTSMTPYGYPPSVSFGANTTTVTYPSPTVQFFDNSDLNVTNIVDNPSMEAGLPASIMGLDANSHMHDWQSSAYARTGTKSLVVAPQDDNFGLGVILNNTSNAITSGKQYYWSAWVYSPNATYIDTTVMGLYELDGSKRTVATGLVNGTSGVVAIPAAKWIKVSGIGTTGSSWDTHNGLVLSSPITSTDVHTYDTGKVLYYDDIVISPNTTFSWTFGDGGTSTDPDPVHVYNAATGTYNVAETATTTCGAGSLTSSSYITINKATPVISWSAPAAITYGTTLSATQLSATCPQAGSFVYSPVSGTVLSAGAGQTLNTTFTPSGADATNYTTNTASVSLTVNKATPTISWSAPANITYGTALSATQLSATCPQSGSFVYNPVSGTILSAGASQTLGTTFTPSGADATNYTTNTASVSINVSKASPAIAWSTPAAINYGTALSGTQLNANANTASYSGGSVAGNFAYNPASGTVLAAGSRTLYETFTPSGADATNYTTNNTSVLLTVNKASTLSGFSWSTALSITYGTPMGAAEMGATDSVTAGTFTYDFAEGDILAAGSNGIHCTFYPTDSTNYSGCTQGGSITVDKYSPHIAWTTPTAITYGTALSGTQLNANANTASYSGGSIAGSFAYNPASGTVLAAGTQTLSETFTPSGADATNYTTNNTSVSLTVNKMSSVITWSNPADIIFGTALSGTQLCATGSVDGTMTYTPASGTVLNAGNVQTLHVNFNPTDSTNYTASSKDVTINVTKTAPTITWSNPANITYGTALSATQLNANANVAGAYTYTPASGTLLGAGNAQTLHVSFAPTDSTNYSVATKDVSINVSKAGTSVSWVQPAAITYGTALSGTQLSASCSIAGSFVYSPASGAILGAGSQTLSVTFNPTDSTNYSSNTTSIQITVNKAIPIVTWNAPSAITYGTALSGSQLNAGASVAGSFSYNPAAGTILSGGQHELDCVFTPTDSANYTTANGNTTVTINKATPTVTWDTSAAINYGTPLNASELNAQCVIAGSFTYDPVSGTVLTVGTHVLNVSFAPTDNVNYTAGSASVFILIHNATPVASFTKNTTEGNLPLAVAFTDTSTGENITVWNWNFGDGSTHGAVKNPTHTYNVAGTYAVTVTSTNDGGSNTSASQSIIVHNATPVTNFTSNVTNGRQPFGVQFIDASTGLNITQWYWDFGDGNTSTLHNPVHVYQEVGLFNVTLTATNDGGSANKTVQNYIASYDPLCAITATSYNGTGTTVVTGKTLSFNETSHDARTTNWYVDGELLQSNGRVTASSFAYTFAIDKSYNVSVIVGNTWNIDTHTWNFMAMGNGTLVVQTVPTGANITINGTSIGDSDGTFSLQPGYYQVAVHYTDYGDTTKIDQISSSTTTYDNRTLTYLPGTLNVTSVPFGAFLYIDGVRAPATTPYETVNLAHGNHTIKLVSVGYYDYLATVTVPPNGTLNYNAIMILANTNGTNETNGTNVTMPGNGSISIETTPDNADVYINGVLQDSTTPTVIENIAVAVYNVTVTLDGYAPITRMVNVIPNKEVDLQLGFTQPAYAHIITVPSSSAEIYIDENVVNPGTGKKDLGYLLGTAPINNITIPVGSHEFMTHASGYYNSSSTVVLPANTLTNVNLPLSTQPNTGQFTTTSQPTGASYLMSGGDYAGGNAYSGITPGTISVYTGKYNTVFSSPNYHTLTTTTQIYNGQTTTYDAKLNPLNGTLCIIVPSPNACRVYVDGILMGMTNNSVDNSLNTPYHITPTYISVVSNITHNVRIEKDGYGASPVGVKVYSTSAYVPINGNIWIVDSLVLSSANGTLYVTTTPDDNEISVDGVDCGAGPDVIIQDITVGAHTISVTHAGYTTSTASFVMHARENLTENVVLTNSVKGAIQIESDPSNSVITIDGQNSGTTPSTAYVDTGEHTVVISHAGYTQSSDQVTVTAGNTANLSRTLTAIPAVLNIDVTPSGAIIYLNNQPLSHVTPYTLSLDAGKYYVKTTLPNYTVFEKTVNLSYGDVVTLNDVMSDAEPPITCTASDSPIVTQDSLSTTTLYAGSEVDLSVSTSSPAQSMVAELAGPNGYVYFILHQVDNTGQHWSVVLHPTEIGNFNVTRYFVTVDGKTRTEQSINNLAFSVLTEPVDSGSQPTANFIPARTYGYVAFAARFTDTSTNLPTSWNWNFGDSGTSTERNPTHTYTHSGVYDVTLTVLNAVGSSTKTIPQCITVDEMPTNTAAEVKVPQGMSVLGSFSPQSASEPARTYISNTAGLNISTHSDLWNAVQANVSSGYALASLMVLALAAAAILKYMGFL